MAKDVRDMTIKELDGKPDSYIGAQIKLSDADKFVVEKVNQLHEHCVQQCVEFHEASRKWRDQFEGGRNAPRHVYYKGTADTYPNITYKHVDTAVSKAVSMVFPSPDFFELDPANKRSQSAENIAKDVMRHFLTVGEFSHKTEGMFENFFVDGITIAMTRWQYTVKKKWVRGADNSKERGLIESRISPSEGNIKQRVMWQVTENFPTVDIVDVDNFFIPDSSVESIDDLDYCGVRFNSTVRALRDDMMKIVTDDESGEEEVIGIYKNTDLIPSTTYTGATTPPNRNEAKDGHVTQPMSIGYLNEKVNCLEYYFRNTEDFFRDHKNQGSASDFDWKSYLIDEWEWREEELDGGMIVVVGNNAVPIRISPMYDPNGDLSSVFVVGTWVRRKGCFFGMGIPELMREYQLEACAQDNQALDNLSKQLNKHIFVDENAGVDQADIEISRPGQVTPVHSWAPGMDIRNMIYENTPAPLPTDFWNWRVGLRREVEEQTGITDIMMGQGSVVESTATEVSARTTASEVRFLRRIRAFEKNVISKILKNFWDLIDDIVDEDLSISILGSDGQKVLRVIKRSQIAGSFVFRPIGAREVQDRFLKGQQIITMLQNPELIQYHDIPKVLRNYYSTIGFTNPESFVKDPRNISSMPSIEFQWRTFTNGYPVVVTGDESVEEHQEAIEANGETFLDHVLPSMVAQGTVQPEEVELIVSLVEQNVREHKKFLEMKQAEQEQMMMMAALQSGGSRTAGQEQPMADTRQVEAASGQFPGPLPSSVGA